MFVKKKINRSGTTSVVIADKKKGYREYLTIGISSSPEEIAEFVKQGHAWIYNKSHPGQLGLDFSGNQAMRLTAELDTVQQFIGNIENVLLNGTQLLLNRVFDSIGFDQISDPVFRQLVISRLSFPGSKSATVEYLKSHFDEDLSLNKIYRYLDKLYDSQKDIIQEISVDHTRSISGGDIGLIFYDVTTLYFESDKEDELRIAGFSKDGKHSCPQIVLGLLVSKDGYPLAYSIHPGNKYEGHTMLPVVKDFVLKFNLKDFVIVADSGLMNNDNITELETLGYKYIIGARIKNEPKSVQQWILTQPKVDRQMVELNKDSGRRLLIGYTDDRARKDNHNRQKGIKRLEKLYKTKTLTKDKINKKGYNKFLELQQNVEVTINYDKIAEDALWDGLKGYATNTTLPVESIYQAYHNLWNIEKSFRISKSKIEIRPMFHFTSKRIEAHICICFVALKVYKELERIIKFTKINLSVDKVIDIAKTITTIRVNMPVNKEVYTKTLFLTQKHKKIQNLFDDNLWE